MFDINDDVMVFDFPESITTTEIRLQLVLRVRGTGYRKWKNKMVYCKGTIIRIKTLAETVNKFRHILRYQPESPVNAFKFHKYFLYKSVS